MSPCNIKVQFHDGSISNGKVLYSDPFLPFGLIQVDVKVTNLMKYNSLPLASNTRTSGLIASANVLLICLADDENYVIKQGKIVNTNRNYKNKYGSLFQVFIIKIRRI